MINISCKQKNRIRISTEQRLLRKKSGLQFNSIISKTTIKTERIDINNDMIHGHNQSKKKLDFNHA